MFNAVLAPPYGGALVNLLIAPDRKARLAELSRSWPSWDLTPRQQCDLELLANGGFSPLRGFMNRGEYESVCERLRLPDGTLWARPVVLDVPEALAKKLSPGSTLALRDVEGVMLAALHVEDVWTPAEPHGGRFPWLVGGRIEAAQLPKHYDFQSLRLTPAELREDFARRGWSRVVAVQPQLPMHRADHEAVERLMRECQAPLLLHPIIGATEPGDSRHYARIRSYQSLVQYFQPGTAKLSLLPLAASGSSSTRDLVTRAIVCRNYGCTHLVAADHTPSAHDDSATLLRIAEDEVGVRILPVEPLTYVPALDQFVALDQVPAGTTTLALSPAELRTALSRGLDIPEWFSFPEVVRELRRAQLPRTRHGFTIFFTGLSGSGKSTTANILLVKLLERGGRTVTLLDGDIVRTHLSSELGFSREHRTLNIQRIGFVAAEITKHGGIAICAPIAPFADTRREVRKMIEAVGGFLLVHVATPVEICESRDRKGLYAKARAGLIEHFTGISDPYEPPEDAEIVLDTTKLQPEESAGLILQRLTDEGYLVDD